MTVEKIFELLENKVAPVKLSDEFCKKFSMYDNSGIIINCGQKVSGILFSLDFSVAAVTRAIENGYNLIVTHHPAIYGGINRLDAVKNPQAHAIAECIKNGVSVISMHLNFDAAPEGIDCNLMRGLGGVKCKTLSDIEGGAYGRVYEITPVPLNEYLKKISREFKTQRLVCHGGDGRVVKKAASFCGAGCDSNAIAFAIREGADVFVSSDLKHHEISELVENGIAVIELTHYSAEAYGFGKIYNTIKDSLGVPSEYFYDERFA